MGIAARMAALMQLHREETYQVQNPTPDLIMRAESARRTLVRCLPSRRFDADARERQWMLHSQDSLHSGPMSPVSLAAADITALLPCNEQGLCSGARAAIPRCLVRHASRCR